MVVRTGLSVTPVIMVVLSHSPSLTSGRSLMPCEPTVWDRPAVMRPTAIAKLRFCFIVAYHRLPKNVMIEDARFYHRGERLKRMHPSRKAGRKTTSARLPD